MSDDSKFLGGKAMDGIQVGGKVYLAEPDVRRTVQAALATNEARNTRIAELEAENARLVSCLSEERTRRESAERSAARQRVFSAHCAFCPWESPDTATAHESKALAFDHARTCAANPVVAYGKATEAPK